MDNVRRMPQTSAGRKTKQNSRSVKRQRIRYFDYELLTVLIFLVFFGLVMLYSASSYYGTVKFNDSMYYLKKQAFFCLSGFVIMLFVSRLNYHWYAKHTMKLYWVALVLMALVRTPLGIEVNGARRWLRVPIVHQFQPSEVAKIAIILLVPLLICSNLRDMKRAKGVLRVLLYAGAASAVVLFMTDNLSTAIIVAGIACFLIFIVHPKTKIFFVLAGAGISAVAAFVLIMSQVLIDAEASGSFRLRRVLVWLNPEKYSAGAGYQVMQGLYAIGSGGFFGKGLGNSAQKMVIPEVQNDMILSVICEELGVFGALIILLLFGLLLYRLMFIAQNAPDMYGALIVSGIFAHIAIQVILNVAVVTNMIPNTGITLPFISYGGTSIWFLMAEMGIALGISNRIRFEE